MSMMKKEKLICVQYYLQCHSIFDLSKEQMKSVLDIADKELTPRGLRTLSPANKFYKEAIWQSGRKIVHIIRGQFGQPDLSEG